MGKSVSNSTKYALMHLESTCAYRSTELGILALLKPAAKLLVGFLPWSMVLAPSGCNKPGQDSKTCWPNLASLETVVAAEGGGPCLRLNAHPLPLIPMQFTLGAGGCRGYLIRAISKKKAAVLGHEGERRAEL